MNKVKKALVAVLVLALLGGAGAAALKFVNRSAQKEVLVASVDSLADEYYMEDTYLDGSIATSVSQNVSVDKDTIIEEVYVQQGDTVSVGDPLIRFDMTLVEMELNIAKLRRQQQEQDLNKAMRRLESLKNGGPIDVDSDTIYDSYDWDDSDSDMDILDDEASAADVLTDVFRTMTQPAVVLAADFTEGGGEGEPAGDVTDTEEPGDPWADEDITFDDGTFTGGDSTPAQSSPAPNFSGGDTIGSAPAPNPTPTPGPDPFVDQYDTGQQEELKGITDGEDKFYSVLDGDSVPYSGKGTKRKPYIFLCSSAKGEVTVRGSFFNKMAGYNEDGTSILHEGGYWYQLEFHEMDTIWDYEDRSQSCIGYYLINGSLLEEPVNMYAETWFTVEDAMQYEPEEPDEPYGDEDLPDDDMPTMTREEAIRLQENRISALQLNIKESDLNIMKLEKKVDRTVISSRLDGTVAYVGDPLTGTSEGDAFLSVKSKDGFYVIGAVSELMLDQVTEGTKIKCLSYEYGNFDAEVVNVADYPESSSYGSYYGDGNPNVSYYSFSATVTDKSLELMDGDWVQITLTSGGSDRDKLVLSKAFVRSENGSYYVYKDDGGVLKRQALTVGGNLYGGQSVIIEKGLTRDDYIAFPYGEAAQEGARTRKGTANDMYDSSYGGGLG